MASIACPQCGKTRAETESADSVGSKCEVCGRTFHTSEGLDGRVSPRTDGLSDTSSDQLSLKQFLSDGFPTQKRQGMLMITSIALPLAVTICAILWAIGGWILIVKALLWALISACFATSIVSLWKSRVRSQFHRIQGSATNDRQRESSWEISATIAGAMAAIVLLLCAITFQGAFLIVAILFGCVITLGLIACINETGWSKRVQMVVRIGAFAALLGIFYFTGWYSSRFGPESQYVMAVAKEDHQLAIEAADRLALRHKEPGLHEYLTAFPLFEQGRLDEALELADASWKKNRIREHGLLKAQILFRLRRPAEAEQAIDAANHFPQITSSHTEYPTAFYWAIQRRNSKSLNAELTAQIEHKQLDKARWTLREVKCVGGLSHDIELQRALWVLDSLTYLDCLENQDVAAAREISTSFSKDQLASLQALWLGTTEKAGVQLALNNLHCWAPCIEKEVAINNLPLQDVTQFRSQLIEIEYLANRSQASLSKALAEYQQKCQFDSTSTDQRLIDFSERNIELMGRYVNACKQLREFCYSSEMLTRRTRSGELIIESMVRGYFGDPFTAAKEFQKARDSSDIELTRILDIVSAISRQRQGLYAESNAVLRGYMPEKTAVKDALNKTSDR